MAQAGQLEVRTLADTLIDSYALQGELAWIGSRPDNQIVLSGENIAPRHAQLIPVVDKQGYLLVNQSQQTIEVRSARDEKPDKFLAYRENISLANHDIFVIGNFKLKLFDGDYKSAVILVNVTLPGTQLLPTHELPGQVTVKYIGEKPDVAFKVELLGLDKANYKLDQTGATLSTKGDFSVGFKLIHTKTAPLAGKHRITFLVTAPDAFPKEWASVSQLIDVAPYCDHILAVELVKSELDDYSLL
ncbi:MAG: FHA domain-containing protein [Caldilineaceae bacterium]